MKQGYSTEFLFLLSYSAIRLLQADPTVCSITDGLVARDGFLGGRGESIARSPREKSVWGTGGRGVGA